MADNALHIKLARLKSNESQSSLYKTKATCNLAVIPPIRFNVKTHHRIYPDTLLRYEMAWNKAVPVRSLQRCVIPATCFFYGRICVYVCIRGYGKQPTFLDSRWHSSLWWPSARIGHVHHLRQIFHVFRSGRSFLTEDEEIRARTRISRE